MTDTSISMVNERLEEYTKLVYEKIQSFKQSAITNINVFDIIRHKLIEKDRNLMNFSKYTIYNSDTIFTYKTSLTEK
jgi:hypothetical protein